VNTTLARTLWTMAILLLLRGTLDAQQKSPEPIAVVNGQPVLLEEVESAAAEDLEKLEVRKVQFDLEMKRDREAALDSALETLMKGRVLAIEAATRKITVSDLVEIEINSAVTPPTDEDVVKFYNANKSYFEGGLGDNVRSIRTYLRDQERQALLDTFVDGLKRKYGAVSLVEPTRLSIPTDGRPSKGPEDAPITLAEFSDFQCPYCRALFPTLQEIASDYKDKVRIVYLQFPLADIHPQALKAAEASLCAFKQGKFWEMHDAMFADQGSLGIEDLKRKAAGLSLDMESFGTCLESGKHFDDVRNDVREGVKAGVEGTPALFVNGRMLVGNQPYSEIRKVIEDELRRASGRPAHANVTKP
jgi:protein-disulfide isomerase